MKRHEKILSKFVSAAVDAQHGVMPAAALTTCVPRLVRKHTWGQGAALLRVSRSLSHAAAETAEAPGLHATLSTNDVLLQVYGANTDVGKTVVSTGLCAAAVLARVRTTYIKPVQTGADSDAAALATQLADHRVKSSRTAAAAANDFNAHTLFSFTAPVSPHLAAVRDGGPIPSDADVLRALISKVQHDCGFQGSAGSFTLVETAGGPLSPGPSGTLQADLYRPLRLPVLLVGDPKLGGISTTLSALESLLVRGYTVLGIAFVGGKRAASGRQHGSRQCRRSASTVTRHPCVQTGQCGLAAAASASNTMACCCRSRLWFVARITASSKKSICC